jgi:uncharacterized protein YjiS (DUF1127 family)
MTALTALATSFGRARTHSGHAFGVVQSLVAALAEEIRVRRSLRQLSAFDDGMLRDIGVDRGSLEDAVRYGRPSLEGTLLYRASGGRSSLTPSSLTEWR